MTDAGYAVECIRISDAADIYKIPGKYIASLKLPERLRATSMDPEDLKAPRYLWNGISKVQMCALAEEVKLIRRYKQEKDAGIVTKCQPAKPGMSKGCGCHQCPVEHKQKKKPNKKARAKAKAKAKANADAQGAPTPSAAVGDPTSSTPANDGSPASTDSNIDPLEDFSEEKTVKKGAAKWKGRNPTRAEMVDVLGDKMLRLKAKRDVPGVRRMIPEWDPDEMIEAALLQGYWVDEAGDFFLL